MTWLSEQPICSQASAVGYSQTSFWDTDPSLLSSGNPTPAKSSGNEQQKDGFPICKCGKGMSDCSIHPSTPDKWIASMQDSLASLLALPEFAKVQEMNEANYSGRSFAVLKQYDPNKSFLKMSQDCSPANPHLAYVAGLIDGEGCLRIQRQSKKKAPTYTAVVQMNMSNKARHIGEQMAATFGGQLYEVKSMNAKWADQWQWRINGDVASNFIKQIRPFLMLKQEQADLILNLYALKESQPIQKNGTRAWTQDAKDVAAKIKERMHILNQKGPIAQGAAEGWYQMKPDLFGTWKRFSGRWPRSGMTRNGYAYELPTVGRHTIETDGGYLPTPSGTSNHGKNHVSGRLDEWGGSSNPWRGTEIGKVHCAAFEEWMLGLPIMWTELTGYETLKSLSNVQSPGNFSEVSNEN